MMPTRLPLPAMDAEEWRLRCELTDFYHLIDFLGWTEMIFNHISVRLPGPEHHYLVNPFGLNYCEITPENLLKVGVDGRLVEASEYPANPAGFALHGAIHESRSGCGLRGAYAHHGGIGGCHEARRLRSQ
jgi:ribulose-5-phosphate 4-epimerase/fuculose-1-phosphate aldolase